MRCLRFQRIFRVPSAIDSRANCCASNSRNLRPLCQGSRLAVRNDFKVTSSVTRLLLPSSPATILWRVVTIVVDSLNCMLCRRTDAHICEEVFKGLPAFADPNSAPTVVRERRTFRVRAALSDIHPYRPFWRRCTAMAQIRPCRMPPVFFDRVLNIFARAFPTKTAATQSHSLSQGLPKYDSSDSAITNAIPFYRWALLLGRPNGTPNHKQSPKALPGKVDFHFHRHARNLTQHIGEC